MIIRNITVIDGTGNPPLNNALVHIEGSLITWVGPESDFNELPNQKNVIDGNGMTLLPGLINCHVHLASNGEANPKDRAGVTESEEALRALRNAAITLAGGVTTVRDCGNRTGAVLKLSQVIANGAFLGPRIISYGRCLTITGGHGFWSGREVDGVEGMRKAVREEIKAGAHGIKVISTGGVLSPGTEIGAQSFSLDELKVAVEEATKFGRKVASHSVGNAGIKAALKAGVHTLEHGSFLDDEAIELLRKNDSYHVPTLSAYRTTVSNGIKGGIHPETVRRAESAEAINRESFRRSLANGIKVAVGTDAGTPYNFHGSCALELQLMVEAGVEPLKAISIGTLESARLLGLEKEIGTVEAGKHADVLLVRGNPLEDLNVLSTPELVIKGGQLVPKTMLEEQKALLVCK